jgi:hypothetical protein
VYYNCVKFHKNAISSLVTTYWIFMKLYTFVVHYLQMSMKEYGCCTSFKRGDNSTYTFTKRGEGGMYLVSATCVKFHKTPISHLGGVALTRYTTPPFCKSIS